VFGLVFLVRRRWGVLGASIPIGVALSLLLVARYGWDGAVLQTRLWVETLARTTAPWALASNAQGLPTVFLSWAYPPDAIPAPGSMLLAQLAAIAVFVAAVLWASPGVEDLVAACCLGVALLSPQAWRATFVLAWPLVRAAAEGRHRLALALVGLVAVLGVVVSDSVLGVGPSRGILHLCPFGYAHAALLGVFLWQARRATAARSAPLTPPAASAS
jgi:hypothetical protein